MASVHVNGIRINTQQIHRPSSRPQQDLLMVHGLASNMGYWLRGYVDALADDFRITLVDLRGHGRSEFAVAGYTPEQLGDDLAAVSEALALYKPHVVAHSFGGVATLNWALRAPNAISSLVILDSLVSQARNASVPRQNDRSMQAALAADGFDVDLSDPYVGLHLMTEISRRKLDPQAAPTKDARVDFLLQSLQPSAATKWLRLVERTDGLAQLKADDGITAERLANLDVPLLAMYGACSPTLPAGQFLAEHAPRGWLEVLAGAGHFFPSTRTSDVLASMNAFWAGISGKAQPTFVGGDENVAEAEELSARVA